MSDPYASIAVLDQDKPATKTDPYAAFSRLADDDPTPAGSASSRSDQPSDAAEPPMPYDPLGQGDIGFASADAADANSRPEGSDAYVQEMNAGILSGKITTPEQVWEVQDKHSFTRTDRDKLDEIFKQIRAGARFGGTGPAEFATEISNDRGNNDVGDAVKAFARGIPAVVGLDDELNAAADMLLEGEDWAPALAHERAIRDYDEENQFLPRLGGQLVGGLGLEAGFARVAPQLTARAFAKQAAVDAMRAGGTRAEALAAARKAFTIRSSQEGAAIGGLYGAGSGDGDLGDRAVSAAGNAIAGAGGSAILANLGSRLASRIADRARARAAAPLTEAQQVGQAAERQGIAILPQDAGGDGVRRATQGAAQTIFGASTVRRKADQLYDSFRGRVKEIGGDAETAADVGGAMKARSAQRAARDHARAAETTDVVQSVLGPGQDMTSAGQVVQRGVSSFMEESAARADALYRRVPIEDEAPASISATQVALRDLTRGMESNPELGVMFSNPRLQGYLRALTDEVDGETGQVVRQAQLSWRDLQEFRTRVGDALDEPRLAEKIAPRQLRALYGALTEDMEATARGQGENALRAWRRANTYYAARMRRVNDTIGMVVGERRDRTPAEIMSKLQAMLRNGQTENAAGFGRILRSLPGDDARAVRAAIVSDARGGRTFDADQFAKTWNVMSERGKSFLLPEPALRSFMDDAAERAAASTRDPLSGMSGEQAFAAFEKMAGNKGHSVRFRRAMSDMSADESTAVRSLMIHRMGLANDGAQNAAGDAFSISRFLTRWNAMTPDAKLTLFGSAEMRSHMDDLALLAERVKGSEKFVGHSNTGAINIADATTRGLGAATVALLTGHPLIAGAIATPIVLQRISAQVLTSKRLLNWIVKAPKKPNVQAQRAHIRRLESIAQAEPSIAGDILQLQARLQAALGAEVPARLAAENRDRPR